MTKKRILAWVLTLLMLMNFMPTNVLAAMAEENAPVQAVTSNEDNTTATAQMPAFKSTQSNTLGTQEMIRITFIDSDGLETNMAVQAGATLTAEDILAAPEGYAWFKKKRHQGRFRRCRTDCSRNDSGRKLHGRAA